MEFQDSAWFEYHREGTAAVPPPGTPEESVLTLAVYHYLMSIGKRHSRVVRERKMDQCDFCHKSNCNLDLITHTQNTVEKRQNK